MNSIAKRNEDSLRKLRLRESYAYMMKDLEVLLDEFRFNMSKTKSVVGFSSVNCGVIDMRDMEPTTRINLVNAADGDKETFVLCLERGNDVKESVAKDDLSEGLRKRLTIHENTESKNDTSDKHTDQSCDEQKKPYSFRPFGVLEPLSAKKARSNIKAALPLICELANLQREIRLLEIE